MKNVEALNIFDDIVIEARRKEKVETDASIADTIAHQLIRSIEDKWDEDPIFFEKFSKLIQATIADFHKGRLNELSYLAKIRELRDRVQNRQDDTDQTPARVRSDSHAQVFWGLARRNLDVAKTASGTTPSRSRKDYWTCGNGGVPWVRTAEIEFEPIYETQEAVSEVALRECSLPVGKPGTVLIVMYGEGKTRGQSAILKVEATFNQACFAIFPNEAFDPDYLQLWLMYKYRELRRLADGRGGSQANLNGSILEDLQVPWVRSDCLI
jgi:hypothetical protein